MKDRNLFFSTLLFLFLAVPVGLPAQSAMKADALHGFWEGTTNETPDELIQIEFDSRYKACKVRIWINGHAKQDDFFLFELNGTSLKMVGIEFGSAILDMEIEWHSIDSFTASGINGKCFTFCKD
jgi:hypothetical protein